MENKAHEAKECNSSAENSWRNQHISPVRDKTEFKRSGKSTESFTTLNECWEQIWKMVLYMHKVKEHQSEDCCHIKKEIYCLIQEAI